METITVSASELASALRFVSKVIGRSSYSALEAVRLEALRGNLRLSGTNLESFATADVAAQDAGAPFVRAVKAKSLAALLKGAKGNVVLAAGATPVSLHVVANGVTNVVDGVSPEELPTMEGTVTGDDATTAVDARALLEALETVAPAMSKDETRYNLCALRAEGSVLVATDSHRLHVAPCELPEGLLPANVVPALRELAKSAEKARAALFAGAACGRYVVRAPGRELFARMVEGEFPDWRRVLPVIVREVSLETSPVIGFADASLAAAHAAKEVFSGIELRINGACVLERAVGSGEERTVAARAETPCEWRGGEGDYRVGINAGYLRDALRALGTPSAVALGFSADPRYKSGEGWSSPIRVTAAGDPSRYAVIMPIRL